MYLDIFFSNPQGTIVEEPNAEQRELINEFGAGVLIDFPGGKHAVVYAVKDFGEKRFHCLVTEAQLDKIEEDNVPYLPFQAAAAVFKAQTPAATPEDPNPTVHPWHGKAPGHVFNPHGVVTRDSGKYYIHRTKAVDPDEITSEVIEP